MLAAVEKMEVGLQLQGATAIEDKLQTGVPDTLQCLRQAGIKVCLELHKKGVIKSALEVCKANLS